ncbi:hypothetical protein ASPBRDRAFT_38900 [Aspergillus brasiliensis CBS 101740]|uniref:Uncharacterized protein n=1 Tax=Aspergillus brasiliensis (strain CBS 101740 / IMI 381727 / IBT 21946) TaxID=767769 RepID=A0A1L9UXK4_ASPBC|nr:hypothetical protein ASPBRDRAFT_38900 [Aspergillus brasiliensis CBS 101740]
MARITVHLLTVPCEGPAGLIAHAHTRERETRSAPDADWVPRDDGTGATGIWTVDCIVSAWANDAHPQPLNELQPTKYEAGPLGQP